jgi:predicted transcriptional regulator
MSRKPTAELSRRERQIMEIIYARGEASAAQVLEELPDPPSYSAVRALLAILVQKGQLKHRAEQGRRYIYAPTRRRSKAGRSALVRVLETFYEGSLEKAVAALLQADSKLSAEELERLSELIEQARQEGR